jgi:4-hydroxybutyrate CoA-transferase
MSWQQMYKDRTISLEKAAGLIQSGMRVIVGSACGTPEGLIDGMLARADELRNVEIVAMVSTGKSAYARPEYSKSFRHNSFFIWTSTRKAMEENRADYTPCFFQEFPIIMGDGTLPSDMAMITVSPPDKVGNVSLGISVCYDMAAAKNAKMVIAEVTKHQPRTMGDSFMHVSEIDYFVETDRPMITAPRPVIAEAEKKIGGYVAQLVKDGDCLQLGYGALPDALLSFLDDKNDLGIHSEMISDGVWDLVEKGVITCRRKSFCKGKIVITFAIGTTEFYQWLDYNSLIDMHPVEWVNDPWIIGQNDNMVSVNSAICVDLLGQAASDMLGPNQYGGVGGQVDFVRGCRKSKGGRSVLALPAASSDGKISRIVPSLAEGQAVTTSRMDVDYIITDYGIARLRGKTMKARARALIDISAPEFRDWLAKEFKRIYGRDPA